MGPLGGVGIVGYGLRATVAYGAQLGCSYTVRREVEAYYFCPLLRKLAVQLGAAQVISMALYLEAQPGLVTKRIGQPIEGDAGRQ